MVSGYELPRFLDGPFLFISTSLFLEWLEMKQGSSRHSCVGCRWDPPPRRRAAAVSAGWLPGENGRLKVGFRIQHSTHKGSSFFKSCHLSACPTKRCPSSWAISGDCDLGTETNCVKRGLAKWKHLTSGHRFGLTFNGFEVSTDLNPFAKKERSNP